MTECDITIRTATIDDLLNVQQIYAYYVRETTATFEEVPPTTEELTKRYQDSIEKNLPYLVAIIEDKIVGYCYAGPFRFRCAYRFTVEESVYVDPAHVGKGIGSKLLHALIEKCEMAGCKQVVSVIAGSDSMASIKLHTKLGFHQVGRLEKVGFKHDQWLDVILMQRSLRMHER